MGGLPLFLFLGTSFSPSFGVSSLGRVDSSFLSSPSAESSLPRDAVRRVRVRVERAAAVVEEGILTPFSLYSSSSSSAAPASSSSSSEGSESEFAEEEEEERESSSSDAAGESEWGETGEEGGRGPRLGISAVSMYPRDCNCCSSSARSFCTSILVEEEGRGTSRVAASLKTSLDLLL